MTIRLPETNIFDRILKYFGKKRGIIFPKAIDEKYGPHYYVKALKENFWKALLRPKKEPLPDNYIDFFDIENLNKYVKEKEKQ